MGISHRYPYIVLMPQFVLSPIIASAKSAMDKLLSDNFSLISFPICTSFFILYSFKINRISGSPQMDYLKKRPYGKGHKKRGELHCATNIKASPNALQKVNTLPSTPEL